MAFNFKFGKLKPLKFFFVFILIFVFSFLVVTKTWAEPNCDLPAAQIPSGELDYCFQKWGNIIDALKPAQESNKKELADLNAQIADLKNKIAGVSTQLTNLLGQIMEREEDLAFTQEVFNRKIGEYYKFLRAYDPVTPFLSADAATAFREIFFRGRVADEDRKAIEEYAKELIKLKADKDQLEKNKTGLASLQAKINERAKFLGSEVAKVDAYITDLTSKQQDILTAKSGSFIASVGDSELADDYNASIKGFRESAPSGSFAIFSFGAYTHRKGMSQYGARGRATSQDFKQILKAYYGKEPVGKDTAGTISVAGYGAMDFETTYLYGIAEMPSSWPQNALKAQAVAARTYAYRYKTQGTTICTDEGCQVFNKGKSDNPPDAWKQAVDDTKGQVLEDVVTYYSSTTGGFTTTSGWDTTDGSGGSNFFDKSYEKAGGSPWAYKAWYAKGYSPSGDKCGRTSPWLTGVEFADIINAALVLKNTNDSRITPVTTDCWGGNPYSYDELRNVASQYEGISSVSSVYVSQGNGNTNEVVVNGSIHISGSEFKEAFNLRAPGYLRIPQEGFSFFNVERK